MQNKKLATFGLSSLAVLLAPFVAFAQAPATPVATRGLDDVLATVSNLIGLVVPILIALAVVFFFYGLATYILKAGEEKSKGLNIMIWGIIAIFVMVSVWGLVRLVQGTFGIDENQRAIVPQVPGIERR
jgi:hypothetical protein